MSCTECNEPDGFGNYLPCCNVWTGKCTAAYTEDSLSNCICCGAEMIKEEETGHWRHWSQMELPIEERHTIHYIEDKPL